MSKKIVLGILLTATIFSTGNGLTAKAIEAKNNDSQANFINNQQKSLYNNSILFLASDNKGQEYIDFKFSINSGKINLIPVISGTTQHKLEDNITVKFLTQGGSVEISRRFTKGTKIDEFKNALAKVELKYGDAIQFIPEQLNHSVRIYGNVINNEGYIFSNGLTNELGRTRVFKLTEEGLRANKYYPI
ncbi:hypothetical protein [Clostridium sp.]|uniref:hypothetical protein n=1 Tax=Clostridium sp. TaxID=1506 RepID=UPI0039929DBC